MWKPGGNSKRSLKSCDGLFVCAAAKTANAKIIAGIETKQRTGSEKAMPKVKPYGARSGKSSERDRLFSGVAAGVSRRLACRRAGHLARRNKLLNSSGYSRIAENQTFFPGGKSELEGGLAASRPR